MEECVGFITRNGILHLYKSEDDLKKDLKVWDDWSMIAWISETIVHEKGNCETGKND